jgi:hypothetical protein
MKMFSPESYENEPCESCDVKPSVHLGHGRFSCKPCWDKSWCPECNYQLYPGHVCPDVMTRAAHALAMKELLRELGIDESDED